ncbi:pyridoxal phosphate-dependent aminotransferase [Herbaspirillum sp. 1130]|uniref:pyridoxal phosphate-dependent aminotransferase n=1 Tax=Herbaspirillum sp. 1130 TaxID=2806562 RepID=UPI001AEAD551|nr:pyridoxal phosphate-dependent aminotransferase [Herbaspirillum sp. 1130]
MIDRVAARRATGAKIISLNAGEPDFDTPKHICEAAILGIKTGHTRYTQVAGTKELREAIAQKFKDENELDVSWQNVIVSNGGKQAIYSALSATLNEGDEVIIPAPYWVSYPEMAQLSGAKAVIVDCLEPDGFKLTAAALEKAITPATRWLILNSPSNPTGAVYSREELAALAVVLLKHPHVLILSDDIYEHLLFDSQKFYTLAQVEPRLMERTLTMNGVSKAYAMTGWRIGFATGPQWLIEAMVNLQGQQTSGASSVSQFAATAALTGPKEMLGEIRDLFERRRNLLVEWINAIPGISCQTPGGAFYVFVSCKGLLGKTTPAGKLLESDEDVAITLLEEANVAVMPGSAFGLGPYLRIAYALHETTLKQACDAIAEFCSALK